MILDGTGTVGDVVRILCFLHHSLPCCPHAGRIGGFFSLPRARVVTLEVWSFFDNDRCKFTKTIAEFVHGLKKIRVKLDSGFLPYVIRQLG